MERVKRPAGRAPASRPRPGAKSPRKESDEPARRPPAGPARARPERATGSRPERTTGSRPERPARPPLTLDDDERPRGRDRFLSGPHGVRHRTFDSPSFDDFAFDPYDDATNRPGPERRAFSTWEGPVFTGGERMFEAPLRALFALDADWNRALTHGFHPYAARLPPSLVRQAVATWSKPGHTILDPFCGSGTVLVEAFAQGRKALGFDASPLAVAISETRTTLLSKEERGLLLTVGTRLAEESEDRARRRVKLPAISAWARREHAQFFPHVFLELYGLRALVFAYDGPAAVVRALRLCLSSMLTKFMRTGLTAPRDGQDKRIGRGVPSSFYGRRVQELVRQLGALADAVPPGTTPPVVRQGDARDVRGVRKGSVNLVLTSPPYAGVYDYGAIHASRFAWLGLDPRPLLAKQVGARSHGLGAAPGPWREGRRAWLSQMATALAPGGAALLIVGDGVVAEQPENAQAAIWAEAPAVGLRPVAWASQDRPSHDKRVRDIFGRSPRREHVLFLERA